MSIEINETNRDEFGGDYAITKTIPKIHPKLGIPLPGTRASVRGASQYTGTLFRGDIIYKADPTREFVFTRWDDDGSQHSRKMWLHLTVERGYSACEAKEWDVRKELRQYIEEVDGQLVTRLRRNIAGKDEYQLWLYVPAERWERDEAALRATNIAAEADARIANTIDDNRVSVLPTTVEVTPHKYNVDDVAIKTKKK